MHSAGQQAGEQADRVLCTLAGAGVYVWVRKGVGAVQLNLLSD